MELGRKCELDLSAIEPDTPCPDADFSRSLCSGRQGFGDAHHPEGPDRVAPCGKNVWQKTERVRSPGLPALPPQRREFVRIWRDAFRPVAQLDERLRALCRDEVKRAYRDFRFERGLVTYADQVAPCGGADAPAGCRPPASARRIIALSWTKRRTPIRSNFSVLLEITRPSEQSGMEIWRETRRAPPRPGHFCMVGDFQQAIYRDPAHLVRDCDVNHLQLKHQVAEKLRFSLIFRLHQGAVGFR